MKNSANNKNSDIPFSEAFNSSAKLMHKTFPNQLRNLLIVSTKEPLFISPEIAEHLSKYPNAIKKAIEKETKLMKKLNATGIAYKFYFLENKRLKLIGINLNISTPQQYPNTSKNMMAIGIADHELGHLVVKNGVPTRLLSSHHTAECAADSFAALRHVQRFGTKTGWFKTYNRAHTIIFNLSPIHYTSAVIQKIENLRKIKDISKLSLKETAKLAEEIASKYAIKPEAMARINKAFENLSKIYKEKTNYDNPNKRGHWNKLSRRDKVIILKELVRTMLKNKNDHDIYRAGKLFIDLRDVKDLIKICRKDPFWIKSRKEMSEFEKTSGIILNLAKAADNYKAPPIIKRPFKY